MKPVTLTQPALSAAFADALTLAHGWHAAQYRKVPQRETPTIPYLSHLLGVASIALEFGANEQEASAALLHDALEDGPQSMGMDADTLQSTIENKFGQEVAHLVDGATDAMPKAGEAKAPWQQRKTKYLGKLPHGPASSLLISASDKLLSARDPDRRADVTRFDQGQAGRDVAVLPSAGGLV